MRPNYANLLYLAPLAFSGVLCAGEPAPKKDHVNSLAEKLEPTRKVTYDETMTRTIEFLTSLGCLKP